MDKYAKPTPVSTLKELIDFNARDYGDKPLYRYKANKEIHEFSYNQVKQSVEALGTAFAEMGLMGQNIAVIGDANPYYMVTYFAAANGGGAAVPLDKELDPKTVAAFMDIADARLIVYTESFNKKMPEIAQYTTKTQYFVPIVANPELMPSESFISLDSLLEKGKAALENGNRAFVDCEIDVDKPAAMIFTSGTTGTSKCVLLSQKNLVSNANACVEATHFCNDDTFVSVLPMNHSYEVTTEHLALSRFGCTTFLNDSIKNALKNFAFVKPTSLLLVPLFVETIHKRIWMTIDKKGKRKTVEAAIKFSNALRKVGIDSYEGSGITECSPLVAVNPYKKKKLGSVGPAVLCCEVRIDKQPEDETGEILVKGDNVMLGYLNNPEANAEVFTEDGWFRTGDLGYMDKDGYIYITGRKKNLIILSNGKNVFPEELEEHLSHNEIVGESVVIARKNDAGEILITAVIYPNQDLAVGKSEDEIHDMVKSAVDATNKSLPMFKHIQAFDIRDTEFEKTTTRKIKRFLVK